MPTHMPLTEQHVKHEREYRKQLRGWLSYAFASEVFVIVSLTLFLPICLEQFARDNGYLLPDKTIPCTSFNSTVGATAANGTATLNGTVSDVAEQTQRCVVKLGWVWIDSASFSLYVYSASVALQALTVISMGGIADHPPYRKRLLLSFGLGGAFAALIFLVLPSSSPLWFMSAFLAIVSNVGFGASTVAMNAYIPSLAKLSPEVKAVEEELLLAKAGQASQVHARGSIENQEREDEGADVYAPLISPRESLEADYSISASLELTTLHKAYDEKLSQATSRISSLGIALGYGAGIFMLLLALIPVTKLQGSTFALRLAIGLSGVWWIVFSLPAALWLPGGQSNKAMYGSSLGDHDDPEDINTPNERRGGRLRIRKELAEAWKRLGRMLLWSEMAKLKNTFIYLAAWFLLSDGFTTITSTAILFAKTTLNMPPTSLILIGVLSPTAGILGSLAWPIIQKRFGWSNLRILVTLVIMASLVPAYGILGFLNTFKGRARFGGLTTPGEMYALAVYFGSVYGAFQGYARAFYAELIPPGEEARWYGLFSITDKSSSFLGPLIVGIIADMTGNIRYAFFFLVFMVWLAVPALLSVDVEKGRKDARAYMDRSGMDRNRGLS